VLKPAFEFEETVDADKLAAAIRAHRDAFHVSELDTEIALAFSWKGQPAYERILAAAQGIERGMADLIGKGKPLYIMLDGDVAQTLGSILREDLGVASEILSIDGVILWDFDYIDLGRIRMPSNTVPVTIKSLIFSEDPRQEHGRHRLHHHGHDHGHDHHHGHGHHDHDHAHGHDHAHAGHAHARE
jgi:ethanolamine utilization protein EutA